MCCEVKDLTGYLQDSEHLELLLVGDSAVRVVRAERTNETFQANQIAKGPPQNKVLTTTARKISVSS